VAREVATVISAEDIGKIAKSKKPARNAVSTELLKGGDYYRVWINHGGTNYLINLPTGA
jgi:hemin uptake protein HemP